MKILFIVFISLAVFLASCSSCKDNKGDDSGKNVAELKTETENKNIIEVKAGEEFEIGIELTPVAGFTWSLSEPLDEKIEFVDRQFIKTEEDPSITKGAELWKFKALDKGSAKITFLYINSRRKGAPPERTEVYDIIIK